LISNLLKWTSSFQRPAHPISARVKTEINFVWPCGALDLPETRGRSLEQLDELFENKILTCKFTTYVTEFKLDATESGAGSSAEKAEALDIGERLRGNSCIPLRQPYLILGRLQ
jgi:hypothetical protein